MRDLFKDFLKVIFSLKYEDYIKEKFYDLIPFFPRLHACFPSFLYPQFIFFNFLLRF